MKERRRTDSDYLALWMERAEDIEVGRLAGVRMFRASGKSVGGNWRVDVRDALDDLEGVGKK